jgi:hypothetical protein
MVAVVIAVLAAVGLAYSFGLGRSFINRFEIARAALGVAQQRLETLHTLPGAAAEFDTDSTHYREFYHGGAPAGLESWQVTWYNDPSTTRANDLKLITVTVSWRMGAVTDSVSLSRLFVPG